MNAMHTLAAIRWRLDWEPLAREITPAGQARRADLRADEAALEYWLGFRAAPPAITDPERHYMALILA